MARLATIGFETGLVAATLLQDAEGDGFNYVGTPTAETTVVYSGAFSMAVATGAARYAHHNFVSTLDRDYFWRFRFRKTGNPTALTRIFDPITSGGAQITSLRLTTGGVLLLHNSAGSAPGDISYSLGNDTWVTIWLRLLIPASGNGSVSFFVDGDLVGTDSSWSAGNTAFNRTRIGATTSTGSPTFYFDDIAVNDDQGSDENTYPPLDGRIYLLKPTALGSGGRGNWQGGAAGTTNLHDAVDNTPPAGLSDAAQTNTSAIENRNSSVPNSAEFDTQTYDDVIPADEDVSLVKGIWRVGTSSTSGANDGTARLFDNPDQGADTSINYEGSTAVAGTDPAGYRTYASSPVYSPSVTRSAPAKLRITKTTSSTRASISDLMGVMVETVPAVADTTPPVVEVTAGPAPNRISKVSGKDTSDISFSVDEPCQAWKVKVVPATSSIHSAGTEIKSGGTVTSPQDIDITGTELEAADAGDGTKIVKVFAQDSAGNWSL